MSSFKVYIIDRATQSSVIALAELATKGDLALVSRKGKGWNFNWIEIGSQFGISVYKITYQKRIQGLVAFFRPPKEAGVVPASNVEVAPYNLGNSGTFVVGPTLTSIVCKYSVEWGFEGFVVFRAKSRLIEHYQKSLGAKVVFGDNMAIDDYAANILIEKYIVGGGANVE